MGLNRAALEQIKKATVALAVMHEQKRPPSSAEQPFTIVGSGLCVDARGIVLTCAHVIEAFMEKNIAEQIAAIAPEEHAKPIQNMGEVNTRIPHALFYVPRPERHEIVVMAARVEVIIAKTNMDLGGLRLLPHTAFVSGYPTVGFEDFENIHEGLEIATCGFPMGNLLFQQLGTVSSSFTRGILSSIIPAAGTNREYVTAFQLDLRATHGNSGGPVFSWESGRVLGVLQGGVSDRYGQFLFSRAESVYRLLDEGLVDQLARATPT
jgi:S1-C subfamily serine protease